MRSIGKRPGGPRGAGRGTGRRRGKRRSRYDKYLNTVLAVTALAVVILGAVLGVILFRQERDLDLSFSYGTGTLLQGDTTEGTALQTAEPFASALCVSEASVAREGVSMTSEREKALLFQLDTKTAMFAQGIYDRAYPASITKIMTALMAIKYGNMSDEVTLTAEDLNLEEGSTMSGMAAGDRTTLEGMFYALMVCSANDAAMAIAEHIGGSVDNFVAMMNEEAQRLGMTGTHFVNPHGLHDDNHYTTAYDIYLMLNEAYQYQQFYDAMQTKSYSIAVTHADQTQGSVRIESTDKYLTGEKTAPKGVTVLGGKTGTTSKAGSCLAIISQNAYGQPFVSIVLNAQNKSILYSDMNLLLSQINS